MIRVGFIGRETREEGVVQVPKVMKKGFRESGASTTLKLDVN